MDKTQEALPVFSEDEQRLIQSITEALRACGNPHAVGLEEAIAASSGRLRRLVGLMLEYPPPLKAQSLGQQLRDGSSLIDALSNATLFTVDMILPMRAMMGQTYVMARLNFFRLLHQVVQEALSGCVEFVALEDAIGRGISQSIHAKVIESILIAIVSDNTLEQPVRTTGARALAMIWEDRFSKRVETFFPVLEATWEARRKMNVQLGTLMGVSEMFALMREGGDPLFIDYFSRKTCPDEEIQAFREFLFGLSSERLDTLNTMIANGDRRILTPGDSDSALSFPTAFLREHSATDFVTQLYLFFVKRHLGALTRRVSQLAGPKRTAEEYVMIYFLEQECGRTAPSPD